MGTDRGQYRHCGGNNQGNHLENCVATPGAGRGPVIPAKRGLVLLPEHVLLVGGAWRWRKLTAEALPCVVGELGGGRVRWCGHGQEDRSSRAIAGGGESLLSRPVHYLIIDRLPDGVKLVDLGIHRLRGLRRPEHVFGLKDGELPVSIEQLASPEVVSNNLPVRLSSFIGRVDELEEVARAPNLTRLLTLTGAGGCGKTRLAAEAAEAALDAFRDGAWWVELGPLTDPSAVGPAVAEAVGVTALAGQPSLDAVIARLAVDRALVVLDNCEHRLEECARTAEKLLLGCPGVKLLVTSRAPLAVAGETAWRVPSLSLPGEVLGGRVDMVAESDAVRPFIERALKVRPSFTLNADNAAAIGQICRELDGVPLAIELAAARVRVLGPGQIAEGLGDRFAC